MVKEVAGPEILPATGVTPDSRAPIPKQIPFIIGNEGCERFSFYGMRNILVTVPRRVAASSYLPEARAGRRGEGRLPHAS